MIKKAIILFAPGFEEVEALTPTDVLRRAGMEVKMISITGKKEVTGAHDITVICDDVFENLAADDHDIVVLPGGMPGAKHLMEHEGVSALLKKFDEEKRWIAAICAAPMILGEMGLLKGRKATCFPGFEHHLKEARHYPVPAITDGHIITGRGIGAAIEFALEIVGNLFSPQKATEMRESMVVPG